MKAAAKAAALAVAGLVALGGTALANDKSRGHEHGSHGSRVERLATELGLDDAQKAEVQRIFGQEHARREAEHEKRHAELRQQLSSVLSPEQLQKFDQLMQQRKEHRDRRESRDGRNDSSGKQSGT